MPKKARIRNAATATQAALEITSLFFPDRPPGPCRLVNQKSLFVYVDWTFSESMTPIYGRVEEIRRRNHEVMGAKWSFSDKIGQLTEWLWE